MNTEIEKLATQILEAEVHSQSLDLEKTNLEGVVWKDFSRMKYAIPPVYRQPSPVEQPVITEEDVDEAIDLEQNDIDSTEYMLIKPEIRQAVLNSIIEGNKLGFSTIHSARLNESTLELTIDATHIIPLFKRDGTPKRRRDGTPKTKSERWTTTTPLADSLSRFMTALDTGQIAELYDFYLFAYDENPAGDQRRHPFFVQLEYFLTNLYETEEEIHSFYEKLRFNQVHAAVLHNEWKRIIEQMRIWSGFKDSYQENDDELTQFAPYPSFQEKIYPYDFQVYMPKTLNLGLQLVHRQEWRVLGNQRGDIVKTIPLGPKQTDKVSIKVVKRESRKSLTENKKEIETNTETSDTTKDSNEVLYESSMAVNASLGAGFGPINASMGVNSSNTSRNTSTALSETMQKTASKMRSETTVRIETEREKTLERTTSSEITNPNDEISLTYVYSKLQRQYEVFTGLSEVRPVFFVALEIPTPSEIDFCWVRRYDWMIAKALLDPSYEQALNSIRSNAMSHNDMTRISTMEGVMNTTLEHLGAMGQGSKDLSVADVDFVSESQKGFRETLKEYDEKSKSNMLLEQQRARLYQHIRDNILHYSRAIWQYQDAQTRSMKIRQMNLSMPLDWNYTSTGMSLNSILDQLEAGSELETSIVGDFVGAGRTMNIADMIDPTGPVDFYGNYALYYPLEEYLSDSLRMIFAILEWPYVNPNGVEGELMDPVLRQYQIDNPIDSISDDFFNSRIIEKMVTLVPELRSLIRSKEIALPVLADDETVYDTSAMSSETFLILKRYYPHYLYRKEMTRRFPVDTNNLIVDIVPGEGTALEKFKVVHRGIDVGKAISEKIQLDLDNTRRESLLSKDKLGDPDIEKVTVVTNSTDLVVDTD